MRTAPGLLLLSAAATWCLPGPSPHIPALCRALGIRRTLAPPAAAVALTFDDGPHPQGTPATLEILAEHGATATFFLVGEQVERRPALAAEIVAAGHEIAIHCHRHRNLLCLTPRALAEDLRRAEHAIGAATGRAPARHRAPYGVYSAAALAYARRRGWEPTLWSRWGIDWARDATPASIAARATADLRAGDIVLLHDADHYAAPGSWRNAVAALPHILAAIYQTGSAASSAVSHAT